MIIRIWATEIPNLTHNDIMVDTEKMVLPGPCNHKFHYQHHYLLWIPTQNNQMIDNGTLKKNLCSRNYWVWLAIILDFKQIYWGVSYFRSTLLRFITLKTYIYLVVYLVNPWQLEAQFGKYVILAFRHSLKPKFRKWPLGDHVCQKFHCWHRILLRRVLESKMPCFGKFKLLTRMAHQLIW